MHQEVLDILIVDDRPENILALEAVLSSSVYNLISVNSGELALKYIMQNDLDRLALILMDVQMPGMDGYETAELIKQRRELRHVPILFITAIYKSKEHVRKGYAAGSVDYIFKPYDPEVLRSKVDSLVNLHRFQRGIQQKNALLQQRYSELEVLNTKLWETKASLIEHQHMLEELVDARTQQLREANREILSSQRRFQTIFFGSPSLLAIRRRRHGWFLEVNDMWKQTTGYSLENMRELGSDPLQIKCEEPGAAAYAGTLGDQPVNNVKISYRTASGELRYGLLSIENMEINDEACQLIVITDITEKEMWQLQLDRLERLNLIGEMAAGIAHEIRNPMTTIRGFLQLWKQNRGVLAEEHIDMVLEELQRANGIITEFLALAKNKTSHFEFHSLNGIITSILPLIQAEAAVSNKEVLAQCGDDVPELYLDEKEIRQVLLNLCINGLEAMKPGGILTVRTYRCQDQSVVLEVMDEGQGIPEELLSKLGTPFFTTKEEGTGLGLALCYSIAERHRATIAVCSGTSGTTFSVRFPPACDLVTV